MGSPVSELFQKYGGTGAEPEEAEAPAETEGLFEDHEDPHEAAPEQAAEPEPAPQNEPAPEPVPPGHVPITAMLDFRERAQRAERELAAYRAQQNTQAAPSIYEDPVAYQEHIESQIAQREVAMRFGISERFAVHAHGADTVKQAQEWAVQQDPYTKSALFNDPDPVGSTVARYQQHLALQQVGQDPVAFAKRWAEQNGYVAAGTPSPQAQRPVAQQQPSARTPPPRSLASAPGASGTNIDTTAGSALEGLKFKLDR